jgi:hypothetical protein
VLAEGVVDAVFVVAVSVSVCSHEGSEFERVVSILVVLVMVMIMVMRDYLGLD